MNRYHNRPTKLSSGARSIGPFGIVMAMLIFGPALMALINLNWQWLLLYLPIAVIFGM